MSKMKHLQNYRVMMKSGGRVKNKFEDIKANLEDLLFEVADVCVDAEPSYPRPVTSVWYYPDEGGYEFHFRIDGRHKLANFLDELDRIDEYMESMGFYFKGSSFHPGLFKKFIDLANDVHRSIRRGEYPILSQTDFRYTNNRRSIKK